MTQQLRRADFRGVNFSRLTSNDLQNFREKLVDSDLRGASFKKIELENFDFSRSLLQGTSFAGAKLINVQFDAVQTGLSNLWILILRLVCCPIALLAGIICGYSSFFLYSLAFVPVSEVNKICGQSFAPSVNSEVVDEINSYIGFLIILSFSIALFIVFYRGIRVAFTIFVVVFIAITFTLTAILPDPYATTSILGLTCFIAGLAGILTQAHASYLNSKLDEAPSEPGVTRIQFDQPRDISGFRIRVRQSLFRAREFGIFLISVLGAMLGAYLSSGPSQNPPLYVMPLPIALLGIGNGLAYVARFDTSKKYLAILDFFDSITQNLETNFKEAELTNVSFRRARNKNANFSGITIKGSTSFEESDKEIVPDARVLVDKENQNNEHDPQHAGRSQKLSSTVNINNNTGTVIVHKEQAMNQEEQNTSKTDFRGANFGGGFADRGSIQIGGQFIDASQQQNLNKAAKEIQHLLDTLSETSPTSSSTEQMMMATRAVEEIEKNPALKQRVVSALTAGGTEALKELVDHPAVSILLAAIEGWKTPG